MLLFCGEVLEKAQLFVVKQMFRPQGLEIPPRNELRDLFIPQPLLPSHVGLALDRDAEIVDLGRFHLGLQGITVGVLARSQLRWKDLDLGLWSLLPGRPAPVRCLRSVARAVHESVHGVVSTPH